MEKEEFELDAKATGDALSAAVEVAARHGLRWHSETIRLEPREDLVKLVERSDRAVAVTEVE